MTPLATPAEAEAMILAHVPALDQEEVPLASSTGRILAAPLVADRPLPPYHRVMMDGISFRHAQGGATIELQVAGIHAAGAPPPAPLAPAHCWEIMTGAALPPDCDTVVPYEEVSRLAANKVSCPATSAEPGRHIHRKGSDFAAGDILAPAHRRIDSRVAAIAATIGATRLRVLRRPRVALLTTGDEVLPPEASPAAHQVRQSHPSALRAALARLDADLCTHLHVPDDEAATRRALLELDEVDLVLVCGGISKGKYDFVRPVVDALRGAPSFHGVAQRPGKPLAFWPGSPPILALPGNPMSVLVCFHRYVVPLLEAMLHRPTTVREAALAAPYRFDPPLCHFLPVALLQQDGVLRAEPRPLANSGDFASSLDSTGFLELPAQLSRFPEGFLAPFREWL